MTDGTMSAVAQQIKPAETFVKQEAIDPSDIHTEVNDDDKSYMFQQKFTIEEAGPSATVTSNTSNEEEPPPKRARRTAAVKAQIAMDPESDEDEDSGEPMTKVEDESEDSDGDDHEPAFVDVPSTSADDQPGPSGVGKDGVEAPCEDSTWVPKNSRRKPQKKNNRTVHLKSTRKPRATKRNLDKPKKLDFDPVKLEEALNCSICSNSYNTNIEFAFHSIKHSNDKKYSCHFCEYRTTLKYRIEAHVRSHEGTSRKYKCEICTKTFRKSINALEHKYFHTGERPFQCEICGKHFMHSKSLSHHRRTTHYEIVTGEPLQKYDCTICNKHYESQSGLLRHNSTHHKDPTAGGGLSMLCDICGKRLSCKYKLKFHLRTHTGYKPFCCHFCSKTFTNKDQLLTHERVHTGEKPFSCEFCGKAFAQSAPYRYHVKTHTGERKHVCPLCNKGFISKSNMRIHTEICNIIVKDSSN